MIVIRYFTLMIWAISVSGCFNPFFPEKGNPPHITSSPERTIQLFKEAYERKDIFAFENLIYDTEEFSSYTQVSHDYSATLNIFSGSNTIFIDTIFPSNNNILPPNRAYYELKWGREKNIHDKMFSISEEIVFLMPFFATETFFETDDTGDTLSALVRTERSQIRIRYRGQNFTIDITGQIFAMKRKNGFWKIWKWIELN